MAPVPGPAIILPGLSNVTIVAIAMVIAMGLAWWLKGLPGREPEWASLGVPARGGEPIRAGPRRALADADGLAREGRFGEAIHALLLRLLAELVHRGESPAAPALTSREVLRGARLGEEARSAMAALVHAAEGVHFGGKRADAAAYEACLAQYQRFRNAWPPRA